MLLPVFRKKTGKSYGPPRWKTAASFRHLFSLLERIDLKVFTIGTAANLRSQAESIFSLPSGK